MGIQSKISTNAVSMRNNVSWCEIRIPCLIFYYCLLLLQTKAKSSRLKHVPQHSKGKIRQRDSRPRDGDPGLQFKVDANHAMNEPPLHLSMPRVRNFIPKSQLQNLLETQKKIDLHGHTIIYFLLFHFAARRASTLDSRFSSRSDF